MILKMLNPDSRNKDGWIFIDNIKEASISYYRKDIMTMGEVWSNNRTVLYENETADKNDKCPEHIMVYCTFSSDGKEDKSYAIGTSAFLLSDEGKTIERIF